MDNQEIFKKLTTIVKSIKANAEIEKNTALMGGSILDSLEFMNFITKVEELFEISITDDEIRSKKLGVISNMVSYLGTKIKKD